MVHKLQVMREELGWSVDHLAELTGLSVGTIYKIENPNNYRRTKRQVAELLAFALECKISDLFLPQDLTELGRPALSGGIPIIRVATGPTPAVCDTHNITMPATGICDEC